MNRTNLKLPKASLELAPWIQSRDQPGGGTAEPFIVHLQRRGEEPAHPLEVRSGLTRERESYFLPAKCVQSSAGRQCDGDRASLNASPTNSSDFAIIIVATLALSYKMETYPWLAGRSHLILPREPVSDGVLEYTIHLAPFEIGVLEWDQSSGPHMLGAVILPQMFQWITP